MMYVLRLARNSLAKSHHYLPVWILRTSFSKPLRAECAQFSLILYMIWYPNPFEKLNNSFYESPTGICVWIFPLGITICMCPRHLKNDFCH